MTKLTIEIDRLTDESVQGRDLIVTLSPGTGTRPAMIGIRQKGLRSGSGYSATVGDVFRQMAAWRADLIRTEKKKARKLGIPWKSYRKGISKP